MLDALALTISHKWQENTSVHTQLKNLFKRILIEDSTQQKLPKTNSANFPGHGNASRQTAGVKVDLTIDLITGSIVSSELHGATQQDREIGKNLVDLVKRNDLVLRDRGYFSLSEFALIEEKFAFWLSRVPANLTIKPSGGTALDTHLKAKDMPSTSTSSSEQSNTRRAS